MYDIIGDIHSCYYEFVELLSKLGYSWDKSNSYLLPPDGRKVVLVGDLIDRGHYPLMTFCLVESMVASGCMLIARGNHEDKLFRYAKGNNVKLLHGLDFTVGQLELGKVSKDRILNLCGLPYFLLLDDNKLLVTHAAWKDEYIDRCPFTKRVRSWCLYGPTTGRTINGFPERIDWSKNRRSISPIIVHGHQPTSNISISNNVYNIDTGCVFGGKLTALRYPEMEIVQVPARQEYCQKTKWGYEERQGEDNEGPSGGC